MALTLKALNNQWIGRDGLIAWPAGSPDLTPLDYILWGYMKGVIYETPVKSEEALLARIITAVDLGTPGIGDRVYQNMVRRVCGCDSIKSDTQLCGDVWAPPSHLASTGKWRPQDRHQNVRASWCKLDVSAVFSGDVTSTFPSPNLSAGVLLVQRDVLRADEDDWGMEQRWDERAGETEDRRENPTTSGIVRHDSQLRKIRERPRRESNRLA
ncbi:hypothetical protein PR048_025229 [Dryococelus australis]|uniref:Uncharacterized protein n=1 Tax=Dryococelus australis TaxID=614101 RepID=A0ABQ9GQQ5_9NEOP|nr:hypothetical protein PR048_025229 [Dryococelus australis]